MHSVFILPKIFFEWADYMYCGHTTAGQINFGHLGLPSVGQHWLEHPIMIPFPAIPFNCSLESLLLRKFFML